MRGRFELVLIVAALFLSSAPAAALEPLGIRVTLEHEEEFYKWFPKNSLPAMRDRLVASLLQKLSGECPYHHWNLQRGQTLTTAIEFEAVDQGSDIVLNIRPVIDGKPGKTVSKEWIRRGAFDRPNAEVAVLAAFKALLEEKKPYITTQIPVGAKQRRPHWNSDLSVILPVEVQTNSDLDHAVFRLYYAWNVPPDQTLSVELDFQSEGTGIYPSLPSSYTAFLVKPTTDPVRRPSGKKLDELKSNETKFDFKSVVIQDSGTD